MAELDLDRWTELYRQTCSLPRADPGGFSDALELAALAASELRRVRAERDGVRAELTRMAGDLEDVRATLGVRAEQLRAVTAERDRLAEVLDRIRHVVAGGYLREHDPIRTALAALDAVGPTPEAPAGPLSAPQAAQEPPAGGIGPTGAQRGAEGDETGFCCDSHNIHCEPPGDLCCGMCTEVSHDTFPIRHADGTTCVLAADVDTASGASEQEGER